MHQEIIFFLRQHSLSSSSRLNTVKKKSYLVVAWCFHSLFPCKISSSSFVIFISAISMNVIIINTRIVLLLSCLLRSFILDCRYFQSRIKTLSLKNDSLHTLASCTELDFCLYLRQKGSKETTSYKVATIIKSKNKVIQENSFADINTQVENKLTAENISSNFLNYLL